MRVQKRNSKRGKNGISTSTEKKKKNVGKAPNKDWAEASLSFSPRISLDPSLFLSPVVTFSFLVFLFLFFSPSLFPNLSIPSLLSPLTTSRSVVSSHCLDTSVAQIDSEDATTGGQAQTLALGGGVARGGVLFSRLRNAILWPVLTAKLGVNPLISTPSFKIVPSISYESVRIIGMHFYAKTKTLQVN